MALCVGAALSLLASLMSAVLWMGAVAGGVTGGGYRGQADYLLPVLPAGAGRGLRGGRVPQARTLSRPRRRLRDMKNRDTG